MGDAAKKPENSHARADAPIDFSRARLLRRGPIRTLKLTLRAMREAAGLTQAQVSKRSGLAQPEISKIEAASSLDGREVSTVRRYLAALGDELELLSVSKHGHRIGVAPVDSVGGAAPEPTKAAPRTIVIPVVDERGRRIPAQSVARHCLLIAANQLMGTYGATRGTEPQADTFAKASDVARQLYFWLDPRASTEDHRSLLAMARHVDRPTKTARADAERFMLTRLPATVGEAKSPYWQAKGDAEGSSNLAQIVLYVVAAQGHADAGKVLRRWGVAEYGRAHMSAKFTEDSATLASEIRLLFLGADDATPIAEELLGKAYRVLGLRRPLASVKKGRARRAKAKAGRAGDK